MYTNLVKSVILFFKFWFNYIALSLIGKFLTGCGICTGMLGRNKCCVWGCTVFQIMLSQTQAGGRKRGEH